MAYALLNGEKYIRAQAEADATGRDLLEIYIRLGGTVVEGDNETIEGTAKAYGIFDEEKQKKKKK